ncbi:MAG: IS481 family transposase [Anaerolineales bacterium]|nr:IS481 family transposase [Anaerolineales bacterium]
MPWNARNTVSLRLEFVTLALAENANIRALCREYRISPTTAYKWIDRYLREGRAGLEDRSRRPHTSPNQTPEEMERKVLALRDKHPDWGGRKINRRLKDLGVLRVPPPSTITEILRRHGRIDPEESRKRRPWQRFEAEKPNDLWQMDFKGHFAMIDGGRCHPLTVLDDHSRFCVGVHACENEQRATVKEQLTSIFRSYGLPERILVDNGPPWGTGFPGRLTRLGVWLVRHNITVVHTGHYHPQTIGKDERFHRTLGAEVISRQVIQDLGHAQRCFDLWREVYNFERPHEALDLEVPASRFRESRRRFPETLAPIVYDRLDIVRKVGAHGRISYRNRLFRVGRALRGEPVALRPTEEDGVLDVYFCHQRVAKIDLKNHRTEP